MEGSAEQRSLARSFNEMTARLERLVRSQREFVADASHQLRTPLTGLRLRLEAARARRAATPRCAEELDAALHEVDRLARIVDELLELSRAGERELPRRAPRRSATLAARARPTAGRRRGASATSALTRRAPTAPRRAWLGRADADRILDALVENALAYSPAGSDGRDRGAPAARLEVRDRGPGLAPGEEEQVFERFHRGGAGRRGAAGHRPRAADRPRARAPLGRRRHAARRATAAARWPRSTLPPA